MRRRIAVWLLLTVASCSAFAPSTVVRQTTTGFSSLSTTTSDLFRPHGNQIKNNRRCPYPTIKSTTTCSTTSLHAVADPGFAVAAITGAITGGFFAGGLHAIAGPYTKTGLEKS